MLVGAFGATGFDGPGGGRRGESGGAIVGGRGTAGVKALPDTGALETSGSGAGCSGSSELGVADGEGLGSAGIELGPAAAPGIEEGRVAIVAGSS